MPLIQAIELSKTYQEWSTVVEAVKGVTLSVEPSEMVAIMGPSGSGKTTLLSMMGCLLKPTGGQLIIQDREVTRLSEKALPGVRLHALGFIFQAFNLFASLTALENLLVVAQLRGMKKGPARREAEQLLGQVGLGDRMHFLPRDLSGGQKQRVSIARALVATPPLILADEPTGNLDSRTGMEIIEILRGLAKERQCGVVIVTHDQRIAQLVDQVLHLEDGILTNGNGAKEANEAK